MYMIGFADQESGGGLRALRRRGESSPIISKPAGGPLTRISFLNATRGRRGVT
jgi:hypothetical protein